MLKIFTPPIFANSDDTRKAETLFKLVISATAIIAVMIIIIWILVPEYYQRWIVILTLLYSVLAAVLFLNRKGFTRYASIAFIATLLLMIFGLAWTGDGIKAEAMYFTPMLVLMAGLLLGWKEGLITGLIAIFGGLGLVLASDYGLLPVSGLRFTPIQKWVDFVGLISLFGALQYFTMGSIRKAYKQAQQELLLRKESEQRLQSINNNFSAGMIYQVNSKKDGSRKFTYLSDSVQQLYGVSPKEAIDDANLIYSRIHQDDIGLLIKAEEEAIKSVSTFKSEARVIGPSGEERWSAFVSTPRIIEDGSICWDGIEFIITERKRAEQALRLSEEKFSKAFRTSPDSMVIQRISDGVYIEVNQGFTQITGYSQEEVLGKSTFDINLWPNPNDRNILAERLSKDGIVTNYETQFNSKDGRLITVLVSAAMITINGEECAMAITRDISDQKIAHEALLNSEKRFRLIIENMPILLNAFDEHGNIIVWNKACENTTGYSADEIIGNPNAMGLLYPDSEYRRKVWNASLDTDKHVNIYDLLSKNNEVRTIEWFETFHHITIPGWESWGMGIDISDRIRMERLLRESEVKFRTLVDNASDSIFLMDNDKIINCNPSTLEMFGCKTLDQIIGHSVVEFSPKFQSNGLDSNESAAEKISAVLSGNKQLFEWTHTKLNGTPFFAEVSLNKIELGNKVLLQAIVRDITERKLLEKTLSENEERMRAIVEGTPHLFFYSQDHEANTKYVSPTVKYITGYSPNEWRQRKDWYITEAEINQIAKEKTHAHLRGEYINEPTLIEVRHRNGNPILLEAYEYPILQNGVLIGLQGVAHDITERKKAEEELQHYKEHLEEMVEERTRELEQSRETFRALAENTKDVIMRVDTESRFLYVNSSIKDVFDIPIHAFIGKTLLDLNFPANLIVGFENVLKKVFETKNKTHIEFQLPNGTWVNLLAMPEFDTEGKVCSVIVSARDITEFKKLQLEIEKALQKEKEISQLKNRFVSMVSHEYRTPLTSILSSIEILEMGGDKYTEENRNKHFDRIKRNIDFMINMIDEVLYVNRIDSDRVKTSFQRINLEEFCVEIFEEIKELYPGIKSSVHIKLNEKIFNVDAAILKKILGNLISNAYKYNTKNGRVDFLIYTEMDKLIFKISDTGIGIPEEEQENVFKPFMRMTNSQSIKGTGLGLSIVKKSAEQLGGSVSFQSEKDEGTTFTVVLPVII